MTLTSYLSQISNETTVYFFPCSNYISPHLTGHPVHSCDEGQLGHKHCKDQVHQDAVGVTLEALEGTEDDEGHKQTDQRDPDPHEAEDDQGDHRL